MFKLMRKGKKKKYNVQQAMEMVCIESVCYRESSLHWGVAGAGVRPQGRVFLDLDLPVNPENGDSKSWYDSSDSDSDGGRFLI